MDDVKQKDTQLITIERASALDVFTNQSSLDKVLDEVRGKATTLVADISTAEGRKEIASVAYAVARTKTYLDAIGKDLVTEYKEMPKKIDAGRKFARDSLDALKDLIRKPLDDWEKEQAQIALKAQIEKDHQEAFLLNIEWELARKKEQERLEKERADYEAKVLAAAEQRAKIAAEEKTRRELIEAEARALAAENELKRKAEQEKIDLEQAQIRAEKQAREAMEKEQRIIREQEEKERQLKLSQENIERVHDSIINDLLNIGLDRDQAKYILDALKANQVKAVCIKY